MARAKVGRQHSSRIVRWTRSTAPLACGRPARPVVNAQQTSSGGGYDTGVTKLSPQGVILWSTYLGGSGLDRPNGLGIDQSGNFYVVGRTYSSNFPLKNPFQQTNSDRNAAYIASYTSSGAMRYSTYVGGNRADWFGGVTVASDGTAWAVGGSSSSNMLVVGGAGYVAKRGGYAYIAAVKPDGSGLSYATYLGGSGIEGTSGGMLSSQGLWLIGRTTSNDFPTAQATQSANAAAMTCG
jgi:Beta-propeller repeat